MIGRPRPRYTHEETGEPVTHTRMTVFDLNGPDSALSCLQQCASHAQNETAACVLLILARQPRYW